MTIEDHLNGLGSENITVETLDATPTQGDGDNLVLRIPSPARLERERISVMQTDESTSDTGAATLLYEAESNAMDQEAPSDVQNVGSAMLGNVKTPARLFPETAERKVPIESGAAGVQDASEAGLAYGIDPRCINVRSETASETSSISMPGVDSQDGSLIRQLLDRKFGANKVRYGKSISIRKAKIFATREKLDDNNFHKVTFFLAGKHSKRTMMDSPLDIKRGDVLELSLNNRPPTPGKESEQADNEAVLQEVFRCVTTVIGA